MALLLRACGAGVPSRWRRTGDTESVTVRVDVHPALLQWARARSGIDDDVWGSRFPRFDAWVAGEIRPTLRQLEEFARKTYTPVGFFFLDEPPTEDVPIPDFRTIGDRPVSGPVTADLLDTLYICLARQEWYRDSQLLNGEAPLDFVGSATVATPPAEVAASMREQLTWTPRTRERLRSWDDALTALRENAEAAGILVMVSGIVGSNTRRKLDPAEFRGFALADPYAALVFVNGADSKAAQVFTLAHEVARLWLGSTALSDVDPASARRFDEERWCNQVAAELVGVHQWAAPLVAEGSGGSDYYDAKAIQVGRRFARELFASTLEARTTYTEAFRLLDVKKSSTFEGLGQRLGIL